MDNTVVAFSVRSTHLSSSVNQTVLTRTKYLCFYTPDDGFDSTTASVGVPASLGRPTHNG
jgi:hypothetical protein